MINSFAHPYMFLLILPLLGALAWAWFKPSPSVRIPSLTPFRKAAGGRSSLNLRKLLPFMLYALGGVAIITALVGPREGLEEIRRRAEGIDIIIALDLSGSMRILDVPENIGTHAELAAAVNAGILKNRLDTAKDEVRKFIESRPNDRIGLIAFAPSPYMVCPPTLDHSWLLSNMERLRYGEIGDMTGIAGPVVSAAQHLKDSDSKRRVVVLFTDGANNINAKVTPRQAAKLADSVNVTVYTVGIGSNTSFVPQNTMFGSSFAQASTEYDEKLLRDIAELTGGVYYHASDRETMAKAMKEIDKLEKTSVEQNVTVNWREFYPAFCMLALALLLAGFFFERGVFVTVP